MAKVALQAPFAKFHGKVSVADVTGGQVLWSVGNSHYARGLVTPSNPQSAHQTAMRSIMSASANGYQALTSAQAESWNQAAAGVSKTNPVGGQYTLSGIALYSLVNNYRQMDGQSLTSTPPSLDTVAAPTSIDSATINGGNIEIVVTHTAGVGGANWLVRLTPDLGSAARRARENEYRVITTTFTASIVASTASPQTIALSMDYFTVSAADNIGVQVMPLSNNYVPGTPIQDRNVTVA